MASAPAIPKGSLVLVTGCNGYIGSNVVDQFLEAGYRVRGTTRSTSKVQGLSALWEKKFGPGQFEVATVGDMSEEGVFDEAVKGVSAVVHVASILTFDPDPNKVIPQVLAGMKGILNSAANEPSVKRFVATSSSTAASAPIPGKKFHMGTDTWNQSDIDKAWAPPPIKEDRAWAVYGASKAQGEKLIWEFVKEKKPHFVVNTVLPNCNFGTILDKNLSASTGDFARSLFKGEKQTLPPQYFIDVQDNARLHVAAAINADVQNERLYAFATPFNWNDVLRIYRRLRPDQKFIDDYQDDEKDRDISTVANERALELLKGMGRPGWTTLEESLKNNIEGM
ncbi:Aldehyde reductase [Lachnellula suecica]|uniref:Aldehyde reductase n=1 Tax=Lachnellula suecica TaxID=602035 RepID=A0A8T9C6D4_9HELO|nr:Aldehyde reductase [Lachnellula suecica]